MQSTTLYSGWNSHNLDDNLDINDALLIAAFVMAALIFLVILRFLVVLLIDTCILEDYRTFSEIVQKALSCWSQRSQDETSSDRESDIQLSNSLNYQEFLKTIIPSQSLSPQALRGLRQKASEANVENPHVCSEDDNIEDDNISCSICLQDLLVNQSVYQTPCDHWFHAECIRVWVVGEHVHSPSHHRNSNHCPNCRYPIITDPAALNMIMMFVESQER
jgi:hypothetical protein